MSKETLNNINKFNIFLGGDHSINQYIVPHYFQKYKDNLHLVWIDLHCDINTEKSSITKNTHGMSVSKIFNIDKNNIYTNKDYIPDINKQLTYLGIRDIDLYELNLIRQLDINFYTSYYCKYNSLYDFKILKINLFIYLLM